MRTKHVLSLVSASLLSLSPLGAAVVYDLSTASIGTNTFGADATTASGGYTASFGGSLPTNLTYTKTNGGSLSFQYFVGTFSTQTLTNVGDTLTLTFTTTLDDFNTSSDQTVRFGLFNIGSATTGSGTPSGNSYSAATGYRADYGGLGSNNNWIRERTGSNANLFASGVSPTIGTTNNTSFTFTPSDGTYSGSFKLELLSGSQVKITSQIGSTSAVSVTDATSAFTSFNSFSFFQVGGSTTSSDFTTLKVEFVPEPSAVALILAGFVTLCLIRRQRIASDASSHA